MVVYYPKFIRATPNFMGLDFSDLYFIAGGLIVSKIFVQFPLIGPVFSIVGITLNKTVLKGIDFKGLVLKVHSKRYLPWLGDMRVRNV